MKKALHILKIVFVVFVTLIGAALITVQSSAVQTSLAEKAAKMLRDATEADIRFGKIHFKPFNTLIIEDLVVLDTAPYICPGFDDTPVDTLFTAGNIMVSFTLQSLIGGEGFHFSQARVKDARMNLVIEEGIDVNLTRMFGLNKETEPEPQNDKDIFSIRDVEVENMDFRMISHRSDREETLGAYVIGKDGALTQEGIDWLDLDIRDICLRIKNMHFKGGVMTGKVLRMAFWERSGFVCEDINGEVRVGRGKAIIKDLDITDSYSALHLPLFMMSFNSSKDFSDFLNLIKLDGVIDESLLDFRTLRYFAPTLPETGLITKVSGVVSGPVCALDLKGIKLRLNDGSFAGTVNGQILNIPDVDRMRIEARISNCYFTSRGVDRMVNAWTEERVRFDTYARGQSFLMSCDVNGLLNSLRIKPSIRSLCGNLDADLQFSELINLDRPIRLKGHLTTKDLDAGKITGNDLLGCCTVETAVEMKLPDENGAKMEVKVDSLIARRLGLLGYDYRGIAAKVEYRPDYFDGKLVCNDPNLNFLFQGTYACAEENDNSVYKMYANVGHADLGALNIDKRGVSRVRFRASADVARTAGKSLIGTASVGGIELENDEGVKDIGDISLTAITRDEVFRIKLKSDFLDGLYVATGTPTEFIDDIQTITTRRDLPVLYSSRAFEDAPKWEGRRYDVSLNFHDSRKLLSFLSPGLYVADSTRMSLKITEKGRLKASLTSPRVAFGDKYLRALDADFDNDDDNLSGDLECERVQLGQTGSLQNCLLKLYADSDNLGVGLQYANEGESENSGEIYALGELSRDEADRLLADVRLLPSSVSLNSRQWSIREGEIRLIGDEALKVDKFALASDDQQVSLSGGLSKRDVDTLELRLERFDLSIVNPLITPDIALRGSATGFARVTSPLNDKSILLDILSDSTSIAGERVGELALKCDWDKTFRRFDLGARNNLDGRTSLNLTGHYTPFSRALEACAELDGFDIGYATPFVKDVFDRMTGELSGRIYVDGPLSALSIRSEDVMLKNGMLNLLFTNVPYYVDGPVHLDNFGAYFDSVTVKDRFGAEGRVNGCINYYNNFTSLGLDLEVSVKDMECINTTEAMSPDFYGQIFGTGNVKIYGPLEKLQLDIDAVTTKTGNIHIPIPNTTNAGDASLLKFKEPEKFVWVDPYEEMMSSLRKSKVASSDIGVNLKVGATPGVTAFIEVDKASGNVLSANGNGVIELNITPEVFDINGNYNISGGNYKFVALGLASRDFSINDGSTIRFNGDIMDSDLNIGALYKTKASLSTLISDTTSVSNRRTVECGIQIGGKLKNPRLGFSINIPEIDATVKSKVESALSTEDKIQKQFLSLIISNSFLPDEQSGIVNNSTLLYSNVSEVMANQLNNILQKLNIPLDFGLNYQPNSKGNDVFDVAVSTQLFNNRLIVNGNIGNKQYKTSSSNSDVVGDIDIEIKLNKSGSLRLNLFSHSADQYSNYLDNSQRNGVGMAYQIEFNGIKDADRDSLKRVSVPPVEKKDTVSKKAARADEKKNSTKKNGKE